MRIKSRYWIIFLIVMISGSIPLDAQQNPAALSIILNHYAASNFIAGAIPDSDLNLIVQAGIRAPSARNLQPWRFTIVQNRELGRKIVSGIDEGNVLIVISAQGDGKTNGVQILDCALAVQSIYLAAQALGYGSRIYTGPIDSINRNFKDDLSLPRTHNAIAVVRIGRIKVPAPDAVSAASSRKNISDLVIYKK